MTSASVNSRATSSRSRLRYLPPAIVVASVLPLLGLYFRDLALDERFRHFPLLLLVVVILLRRRWPMVMSHERAIAWKYALPVLIVGYAAAVASVVYLDPQLMYVAAVVLVAAWLLDSIGRSAVRLTTTWLLLWLLLPLPVTMESGLSTQFQAISTRSASLLLDFARVDHLLTTDAISVPGGTFAIEDIAAGPGLYYALAAFWAALVVVQGRRLISSVLLLVASMFWAVVADVLGVFTIVAIHSSSGFDLLTAGWRPAVLAVTFLTASVMIFCTDRLLAFFFEPLARRRGSRRKSADAEGIESEGQPSAPRLFRSWIICALFAATVGIPSLVRLFE